MPVPREDPATVPGAETAEPEVYTLRVWRHGTQFRAVLRAVGGEQLHLFTEPRRVAEFLSEDDPAQRRPP